MAILVGGKSNVVFSNIKQLQLLTNNKITNAPYTIDSNGNITSNKSIINAIDIDWNNATADGITDPIQTTTDLIALLSSNKINTEANTNNLSSLETRINNLSDILNNLSTSTDNDIEDINDSIVSISQLINNLNSSTSQNTENISSINDSISNINTSINDISDSLNQLLNKNVEENKIDEILFKNQNVSSLTGDENDINVKFGESNISNKQANISLNIDLLNKIKGNILNTAADDATEKADDALQAAKDYIDEKMSWEVI